MTPDLIARLLLAYEAIVFVDFEFVIRKGELHDVVCVAWRVVTPGGQTTFRLWRDQLGKEPPYRIDAKVICLFATLLMPKLVAITP